MGFLILAIWKADHSDVVVYNESEVSIPYLRVHACGLVKTFHDLPVEGSVRWRLFGAKESGEVALYLGIHQSPDWVGGFLEPRGGTWMVIRYRDHENTEYFDQLSSWKRFFE